jgi:hypothetical protein
MIARGRRAKLVNNEKSESFEHAEVVSIKGYWVPVSCPPLHIDPVYLLLVAQKRSLLPRPGSLVERGMIEDIERCEVKPPPSLITIFCQLFASLYNMATVQNPPEWE